jgi:hypothetical protein
MRLYQHLRAPNDPNGNPQRVFVVYDTDRAGDIVAVIDEGYSGRQALRNAGIPSDTVELPSINISRAEYHAFRRIGREKAWAAR